MQNKTLRLISTMILLVGLSSAIWINRTAGTVSGDVLGYETADGTVYPVMPEDSRKFIRAMEMYGGKSNLLVYELKSWFSGLWRGKNLAYSIASISFLISLAGFLIAHLQDRPGCDEGDSEANGKGKA
jgi:di/tricarboxylate transporter